MKIDIFNHIFPKKFFDKYIDKGSAGRDIGKRVSNIQTIVDVEARLRVLDEFGDYVQVISLPLPPLEIIAGPRKSPEIASGGQRRTGGAGPAPRPVSSVSSRPCR